MDNDKNEVEEILMVKVAKGYANAVIIMALIYIFVEVLR